MAEGRMLKKRISKSIKFSKVKSLKSRLLYLMMLPHLDIEGRFEANPVIVKGYIVPLITDITPEDIAQSLEDLSENKLIYLYECEGEMYLQYTRFEDFQSLRKDKEIKSSIPGPAASRRPPGGLPTKRREEKRRYKEEKIKETAEEKTLPCEEPVNNSVTKSKETTNEGRIAAQPSAAIKEAFERVYKDGFNIYQLVNKGKSELKRRAPFPDEVMLALCEEYWKSKPAIRDQWPWFVRVLKAKSAEWQASQNIKEHNDYKKPGAMSLGDILAGIAERGGTV